MNTQRRTNLVRLTMAMILTVLVGVMVSPAQADTDPVWIAHRAIKMKILKEAGDRYGVEFYTTHVDRLQGRWRQVTGKGRFRRRGKSPQNFTYHTDVNVEDRSDKHTGYDIR